MSHLNIFINPNSNEELEIEVRVSKPANTPANRPTRRSRKNGHKDPMQPSVAGFGCRGSTCNSSYTDFYRIWLDVIDRCHGTKSSRHKKFSKYSNCTVGEDFRFQDIFAEWASTQKGSTQRDEHGKRFACDHDILELGNTVYTASRCCFVPQPINIFFSKSEQAKGYTRVKDKFKSSITIDGKAIYLGTFATQAEAQKAYQIARKKRLIELANKYKHQLDDYVYDWLTAGFWQKYYPEVSTQ